MARWARGTLLPLLLLAALGLAAACASPEASRTRAGGPGADVGNHGQPLELHGAVDPTRGQPRVGKAAGR